MDDNDRDGGGRFALGNQGGPGRPKRATEAEHLQGLSCIVSVEDLRAIARRAVADAKKGSARARDWVSRYLLGVPAQKPPARPDHRFRAMIEAVRSELASAARAAVGPSADTAPRRPQPKLALQDTSGAGQATPPSPAQGENA
jgi:hypothetical protein